MGLIVGITVSIFGNKLLFKNADGGVIREKPFEEEDWKSLRDLMTPEEAARYDKYWQDTITSIPKGERPDPTTYLSQEFINEHLAQFENGASYILPETDYDLYYRGMPEIARNDGTLFVTSTDYMNKIITEADGDLAYIEKALGYPEGSLKEGNFKIITIENPTDYHINMPSGNEAGANAEWIPGGSTSGGVPEAIVHNVPNDPNKINIDTISLERK